MLVRVCVGDQCEVTILNDDRGKVRLDLPHEWFYGNRGVEHPMTVEALEELAHAAEAVAKCARRYQADAGKRGGG